MDQQLTFRPTTVSADAGTSSSSGTTRASACLAPAPTTRSRSGSCSTATRTRSSSSTSGATMAPTLRTCARRWSGSSRPRWRRLATSQRTPLACLPTGSRRCTSPAPTSQRAHRRTTCRLPPSHLVQFYFALVWKNADLGCHIIHSNISTTVLGLGNHSGPQCPMPVVPRADFQLNHLIYPPGWCLASCTTAGANGAPVAYMAFSDERCGVYESCPVPGDTRLNSA